MRGDPYGSHRVISPKGLLPQAAERVDNSPTICSNEILIDVIALQPTATAFGRIKQECGGDVNRIAQEIQKIVDERGKFQDPVTKSGGILIGRIKEIGADLAGSTDAQVGDKIATLVSLSLTPLKINEITSIDVDTEQVFCKASAILFESGIYTKLPKDLGDQLSLALMDVAGAPAQVAVHVKAGDTVVVVGAGKAGLLCLAEAKKRVAPTGKVICMEYSPRQCEIVRSLGIADVVLEADAKKPLEALDIVLHVLRRNNGAFFDKHRNVGPRLAIEAVGNILAALINSAAIIVNPGAFRQIDPLHGLTTFCDRGNEQPLSKHPGIGVVSHVFVVGIVEQQGIHQPQTGVIGLPLIRIHVRDQGIPLLNGGLGHFFRRCTKVPRLALLMICSMDAENRTHRSELQPSGVELRTGVFNVPGVLVEAAAIAAPLGLPVIDGGQHRSLLLI